MALRFRRKKVEHPGAELRTVLGELELPTFPSVVMKTLETLRHPDSSAAQVGDALGSDPGLTVRLLKLVNSAGFSPARPVSSVDQAVAVAGFGTVESMVLAVGVNQSLPPGTGRIDHARFWMAASRRATTARAFANELHPVTSGLSFTASLLQEMAVPLLATARDDYVPLLEEWNAGGAELHDLEMAAFGWSHCQVAEWLCDEWDLPADLAGAISGHHGYGDADAAPPAVQLVAPFREVEMPDVTEAIVARATEEFSLAADLVVELLKNAEAEAVEVAGLFS